MSNQAWDALDVLEGMLALMGEKKLPASVPAVHGAFHDLAQKRSYKAFVAEYLFQRRTGFFFSVKLQTYLENLELAGLVSCVNPHLSTYEIQDKLETTFQQYVKPKFSKREIKTLGRMAREFRKRVTAQLPAATGV